MLAARPTQVVATSFGTYCMVSKMARPALTLPPGELMYMLISASASSLVSNNNCAMTVLATASSMGVPRKMIRSRSRRE